MRTIWLTPTLLLAACISTPSTRPIRASEPSPYLLILAADKDGAEEDFFAVVDVRQTSETRGKVIDTKTYGHRNSMPHHLEYTLPGHGELLFANAHHPEVTMLVDVSQAPAVTIRKSIKPPPPFRFTHDYARLANGNVLMSFLRSEGASPTRGDPADPGGHGGIAEFTGEGQLLRSASAAVAGFSAPVRSYAILPMLDQDRIVTTSARMMEEYSADVVQVWRYSDLKLLHTISLPPGKKRDGTPLGWSAMLPFAARRMADGSVLINSFGCAFYRLTDLSSAHPRIAHVYDIHGGDPEKQSSRIGCSVPVVVGNQWIMPVAWSQMIVVLDVSDPSAPREITRLKMPSDFNPHWAAKDPRSNRIVIGAEFEKEAGMFVLLHDAKTGALTFDATISSAPDRQGYINLNKQTWPHGASGPAWGHAALFLPAD